MKLTPEQREKFVAAAGILDKNRKDMEKYADRTAGITNGDSLRKKKALDKLLAK